jgi:hypothetical protein
MHFSVLIYLSNHPVHISNTLTINPSGDILLYVLSDRASS